MFLIPWNTLHGISFSLKKSRELWSPSTLPSQREHFHLNNTSNINANIFCVSPCQHTILQLQCEHNNVPSLTYPTTQIKCLIVESSLQVPWWADYAITSHVIKTITFSSVTRNTCHAGAEHVTSSYFLSASSAMNLASFNWFSNASIRSSSARPLDSRILRALHQAKKQNPPPYHCTSLYNEMTGRTNMGIISVTE